MVQLILSSTKGNQGGKYFPYIGYLGLTPVRVEGIVRTKLDSDLKTLPSKCLTISVRCYESRIGRVNTLQSNILVDYTQTLWSKADNVDYDQVGVLEFPFRIWIPTQTAGFSTAVFVDYRCTWRIEAVLHHAPITGVGSRQVRHFEIPLVRYDVPRPLALPEPREMVLDQTTSKPRVPRIRYCMRMPSAPIGPLDLVSIPLHMQPVDQGVSIRSASVTIERRIQLHDMSTAPTPSLSSSHGSTSNSSATRQQLTPSTPSANAGSRAQNSYFASQQSPSTSSPHPTSASQQEGSHDTPLASSSHQQYHHKPTESTSSLSSSNPTITPETVFASDASIKTYSSEHPLLSQSTASSSTTSNSSSSTRLVSPVSQPPTPNGAISPHAQSTSQTPSASPPSSYSSPFLFSGSSASSSSAKVVANLIVGTETESFTRDPQGIWSKTLTLQWPASKSHSRWAIGETINSDLVSVRFFVRVKVTVSSPSGGTDTVELAEKELLVVSTNESERQLGLAKYAELAESSTAVSDYGVRSKSKSPRRLRPDTKDGRLPEDLPPSPALPPETRGSSKPKTPRRPHTSAGPRDKSALSGKGSGHQTASSTSAADFNKRQSDLGWAHPSMVPKPASKASENGGDINALWGGITRVETRPGSSSGARPGSRKGSDSKKDKEKSSRLPSTSFWAVAAPPAKSRSGTSSKGTRSAGAVLGTGSTSTTGSSSSTSSYMDEVVPQGRERDHEFPMVYSTSSGTDEEEERRRRRYQKQPEYGAVSSSPPSSFQMRGRDAVPRNGPGHVREWEEELARIEEKSRKESDASGFANRMRKKSFMSTLKGLVSSSNSTP
ncbi:hypothetical protein BKA70DRAFT_1249102 [Coprinopsis sp. MPI-PUGE-AT-0042]|nr:hypothetical protein BKA70DRAFT_1249102 [Coprinopsis sp. MPI-PUGE-AT-0042]